MLFYRLGTSRITQKKVGFLEIFARKRFAWELPVRVGGTGPWLMFSFGIILTVKCSTLIFWQHFYFNQNPADFE